MLLYSFHSYCMIFVYLGVGPNCNKARACFVCNPYETYTDRFFPPRISKFRRELCLKEVTCVRNQSVEKMLNWETNNTHFFSLKQDSELMTHTNTTHIRIKFDNSTSTTRSRAKHTQKIEQISRRVVNDSYDTQ